MDFAVQNNTQKNKQVTSQKMDIMQYGYVPPQAIDLEAAVLGACMLERDAVPLASEILQVGMFYKDAHNTVFDCILRVYNKGIPPDILVVVEELKAVGKLDEVGGPYVVTKLTNSVVSAASIEHHSRIIYQTYCARQLIKISHTLVQGCYESHADVFDLMDMASESFYFLQEQIYNKGTKDFGTILLEQSNKYDQPPVTENVSGIPTGFRAVDLKGHGWQDEDLIILAARPSMGKSALAGEFAFRTAFMYKHPVLLFSLEMKGSSFVDRIVSSRTRVFMDKLQTRMFSELDRHEIIKMVEDTHQTPLYINDQHGQTLQMICAEARKAKRKHDIKLIIIDYLQLISLERGIQRRNSNRDQDLGIITNGLKQLAKQLQVPIIALSQLSRATEKSDHKRPQLSHLRESGNIEQDADIVMFLHRPYYYVQRENPGQIVEPSFAKQAELIYAKHRNGALGVVDLIWLEENAAFLEGEDYDVQYF
jgi:replicative DNA helicase